MSNPPPPILEPPSRTALRSARRIIVKAGTSIVANDDGRPSLTRLGAIVEQISEINRSGVEIIFVSSGAVGMGKRLLRKYGRMNMSFMDLQNDAGGCGVGGLGGDGGGGRGRSESGDMLMGRSRGMSRGGTAGMGSRVSSFVNLVNTSELPHTLMSRKKTYDSACAAAGQFEMMNLYSALFDQCDVAASQILLTQADFLDTSRLQNLTYAVERLLSVGIIPIINENDAVSANKGYCEDDVFSDNDSMAALCARYFGADALLLLTDVEGVYDRPPGEEGSKVLNWYFPEETKVGIGEKSAQGRGGMASKIKAAVSAVREGSNCRACVIASGRDLECIRSVFHPTYDPKFGKPKGTLFVTPGSDLERQAMQEAKAEQQTGLSASEDARQKALSARNEARKLSSLPYATRQNILRAIADALLSHKDDLLAANALDLADAETNAVAAPLVKRLKLTEEKLATLAAGINQIASGENPLDVVKSKRELAEGLELSQITVPIGVLMIIFESRPDSLPQIASLALASGNGLLLKGGKEAARSNEALHRVIGDAIESGSGGAVSRDIIALVTTRSQVTDMLSLDDVIDLVIPRGSNALVSHIKQNTRIPVLGHADGVCHVYVDATADAESACQVVLDAKTDYPSACNAMETLLLHEETLMNGVAMKLLMTLRTRGVRCLGGPKAMSTGLCDLKAEELKCEYGDLTCMVEVVGGLDEAVDWIHAYGSGHTEAIVCAADSEVGEEFLKKVDAACVFKNASTRFADGFRFGLGAEVGISTGRIHARGPVGVEGLLTTKWQLRSKDGINYVGEFGGDKPSKKYTHKELM